MCEFFSEIDKIKFEKSRKNNYICKLNYKYENSINDYVFRTDVIIKK